MTHIVGTLTGMILMMIILTLAVIGAGTLWYIFTKIEK